jgi:hypothetical protein
VGFDESAALVAAAGDDAIAVVVAHAKSWTGLRQVLGKIDGFEEVVRREPWLGSDDPGPALWQLFGIEGAKPEAAPESPPESALAGWDQTRPLVLALVGAPPRPLLGLIESVLFGSELVPMHLRVLVPTTDTAKLTASLKRSLSAYQAAGAPSRYLLPSAHGGRLAIAVMPAEAHVRVELLAFGESEATDAALQAQLDGATKPLRPRPMLANDPIAQLLTRDHALAASLRPRELAQLLWMSGPVKVRQAIHYVDPAQSSRLMAMAISEILEGYLVTTAGEAEIAEAAAAVWQEPQMRLVTLIRPTPAGRPQLAALVDPTGVPAATTPDALASLALVNPEPSAATAVVPLFSPEFAMPSTEKLLHSVQVAGLSGWVALLARPAGAVRALLADPELNALGLSAGASAPDITFEFLDIVPNGGPSLRLRFRLPRGRQSQPAWLKQIAELTQQASGLGVVDAKQDSQADGTWLTWTLNPGPSSTHAPVGRAKLAPGTQMALAARPAAIMARLEKGDSNMREQHGLLDLVRQCERVEGTVQLQQGWLVGQLFATPTGAAATAPLPIEIPAEAQTAEQTRGGRGRASLERAMKNFSEALEAMANVASGDWPALWAQSGRELRRDIDLAKREPDVRDEAIALDRLIDRVQRMLEDARRKEAAGAADDKSR